MASGPLAQRTSAMTWLRLDLGVGIVVSAGLDLLWDDIRHLVDVVEVEPQTMWTPRQDSGMGPC